MLKSRSNASRLRRRRLASGVVVKAAETGRTWQDLVAPGPAPTGGAAADPHHPSRKHDVECPAPVYLVTNTPDLPRAQRRAQRQARKTDSLKSRRATNRAALAESRGPIPSRAVVRWAEREHARDLKSPALALVVAAHQKAADLETRRTERAKWQP